MPVVQDARVQKVKITHVTALEHELGNDTVEARAGVAEALLASAESTEVGGGLGDDVVVELEADTAGGGAYTDLAGGPNTTADDR